MPEKSLITVIETPEFISDAKRLMADMECLALINAVAADPEKGDLIVGTGGARKLRWARPGKGKSGGFRVVYFFHSPNVPVFLLAIFAKNERVNLSQAERNELAKELTGLVRAYRKPRIVAGKRKR